MLAVLLCHVPQMPPLAAVTSQDDTEMYRVIRVPRYLTGVNLAEVAGLVREGSVGLYDQLLPHQVNTVHGMFYHAVNRWTKGVLLADQTGLGKLVQAMTLAAAVESYYKAIGAKDYSGVLFVFPSSIYEAQVNEMYK